MREKTVTAHKEDASTEWAVTFRGVEKRHKNEVVLAWKLFVRGRCTVGVLAPQHPRTATRH
jgi:hypothetical protein